MQWSLLYVYVHHHCSLIVLKDSCKQGLCLEAVAIAWSFLEHQCLFAEDLCCLFSFVALLQ